MDDTSTTKKLKPSINWTMAEQDERIRQHLDLFRTGPSDAAYALGPTRFPKPTDTVWRILSSNESKKNLTEGVDDASMVVPNLKPIYGKHRPDQDAVFAYAAEYKLSNYVGFISSLRKTGFTGDIVLGISELDKDKQEIWEYLTSDPAIVLYAPTSVCFNFEQETVDSVKGGMRTCIVHYLYGIKQRHASSLATETVIPLEDLRPQRTLQISRYEIYWIMIHNYNPNSWLLFVDARDTVFQSDPFQHVPRQPAAKVDTTKALTKEQPKSGLIYMFGENMEATRLGLSESNRKWLISSYGEKVFDALSNKPTICSGATMGEQIAMETYLRGMVMEADDTGVVLMGADQGFHNYLYYSSKLLQVETIHDIVVFDQGSGLVNNLGAMRKKPLEEWGNGNLVSRTVDQEGNDEYVVKNWDGTPSPIVHQFDRHTPLSIYFYKRVTPQLFREWKEKRVGKN